MKTFNLTENSKVYTSNVYLILGEWNSLDDVNTLIDVGNDPGILEKIDLINTGLGKRKVDQVILTHSHSDHTAMLQRVVEMYHPEVFAFNMHFKGVHHKLDDGDKIRIGEKYFEVFHITAHSYDSICLYCEDTEYLFAGDTTFPIEFENITMEKENARVLNRLCKKNITKVFYGHGAVHDYSQKKFRTVRRTRTEAFECDSKADF